MIRRTFWGSITFAACLLLAGAALAAQGPVSRLAVLEFSGGSLAAEILGAFSDAVRGGAVEVLGNREIKVMTRESTSAILRDMGKSDCAEGDCEVETARNIGADYVVSGSVLRIEEAYVVTLKLHESKEGGLLATETVQAKTLLEALTLLKQQGKALVEKLLSAAPARPAEAAPIPARPAEAAPPPTEGPPPKSQTSGLAICPGIGFHTALFGVEADYYIQISPSFRFAPYVGAGWVDGFGRAAGVMLILGGRHRGVIDLNYLAASDDYILSAMAGYEYVSDGGFLVRGTLGVGYEHWDTGHSTDSRLTAALSLALGYKIW